MLRVALIVAVIVLPLVAFAPVVRRGEDGKRALFRPGLLALVFGAAGFGFVALVARVLRAELGIAEGSSDVVASAFSILITGPLAESVRVLSVVLPLRSKELRRPYDAMRLSFGAALGFAAASAVVRVAATPIDVLMAIRVGLGLVTHLSLSGLWGFAIGRERRRSVGGKAFQRSFLAATLFGSVAENLLFEQGKLAIWAALPLALSGLITVLVARRDLLSITDKDTKPSRRRRLLRTAPSIEELERALLRKPERPLLFRWIVFGALVTTGVLTALVAASIVLGHRTGVDFAAVDDAAQSFGESAPPLILLGTATLSAFPFSGYLIARASAAQSVLEPALGSSVAIVGMVVLLGLAAPVAVVFALAVAPVAFALACGGAWIGLERTS